MRRARSNESNQMKGISRRGEALIGSGMGNQDMGRVDGYVGRSLDIDGWGE